MWNLWFMSLGGHSPHRRGWVLGDMCGVQVASPVQLESFLHGIQHRQSPSYVLPLYPTSSLPALSSHPALIPDTVSLPASHFLE